MYWCTYDLGRILVAHWTFMFLRCMRKRSATGIMWVLEHHSFTLWERYYVVMILPFSDTLRQFAMVFVSIVHDVQFCTVSIHMHGGPFSFRSQAAWLNMFASRRSGWSRPSWSKCLPAGPMRTSQCSLTCFRPPGSSHLVQNGFQQV